MRLENYSVAAFEALEPEEAPPETSWPAAPVEPPPAPVAEAPSTLLSDMARQPPLDMPLPVELPRARLPRIVDGDGPRRPPSRERFERDSFDGFDAPADGGGHAGNAPAPAEVPAPVTAAPASVPAAPVAAPAPAATPAAIAPAPVPAPDAVPSVALSLPQGDVVNPAWLAARETAVQALHTDIEAARAVARSAPPADVAAAPGTGWVPAPTDGDGNPVAGSVFVPDAAAAAAAPAAPPAWMLRDGATPTPAGQWLSFDDAAFEQAYRERLAAQPEASAPLNRLAQLYGQPPAALLGAHPEVWTLATQPHAVNAGAPPVAGLAMGDAAALGQLDLYLADPFITQLRSQLGGTPAAPMSSFALEQQRLYGPARYAELTQLSQALAAVRQTHAAAMQAARDGGGPGWVEMPLQFGTDPETGWPTGQYVTTGDGEILRDANGMPVIATQRVFDEARFTNAWLAEGGLAQQAFASFYGQAQSHLSLQQDQSENAGPPRWVSQPGLDNPHVGLGDTGVLDGDLISLDLNHTPRLNDDAAVGFDLQLGWVTGRGNLHQSRSFLDKALPIVITVMAAYAGGVMGGQLLGGTFGTTIGTGIGAGAAGALASGIINGDLSFKGVLRGALSGALTAGLTQGLGSITQSLSNAGLGGAANVLTRMTVGGAVQSLLGGSFKQGALSGLGAGLAQAVGDAIAKGISDGALQGADKFAAQAASRVIASALRALTTPGDPGQAFASDLLSTLVNDGLSEAQKQQAAQQAQALQQALQPGATAGADGEGVQTFPVPAQPPSTAVPLPGDGGATGPSVPAVPSAGGDATGTGPTLPTPAPASSTIDRVTVVADPRGGSLSLQLSTDEQGQFKLTLDPQTSLIRTMDGKLLLAQAPDVAEHLPAGAQVLGKPGQTLIGSGDRVLVFDAGTSPQVMQLAALLHLNTGAAVSDGVPGKTVAALATGGALAWTGAAQGGAAGTLELPSLLRMAGGVAEINVTELLPAATSSVILVAGLVYSPSLGGPARFEAINDNLRLVLPTSDVTHGALQVRVSDAAGQAQWIELGGGIQINRQQAEQIGAALARTSPLSPEEIKNWQSPLIYLPGPDRPNTPPPLTPPPVSLPILPGKPVSGPALPVIETFPENRPLSIEDLIHTRDPDAQRRFRGEVCAEGFRLDKNFEPGWYDAHHIIPLKDYAALDRLRERFKDWGIDLNSLENGVALPNGSGQGIGTPHSDTQHNPRYEQALRARFNDVFTREEALVVLGQIKQELRDGTFIEPKEGKP